MSSNALSSQSFATSPSVVGRQLHRMIRLSVSIPFISNSSRQVFQSSLLDWEHRPVVCSHDWRRWLKEARARICRGASGHRLLDWQSKAGIASVALRRSREKMHTGRSIIRTKPFHTTPVCFDRRLYFLGFFFKPTYHCSLSDICKR